ncbi:MAG: histidine kinase [Acidimicrobiia bacterium]|nr:histidine kinase [Acidimicrobiia bacterium]
MSEETGTNVDGTDRLERLHGRGWILLLWLTGAVAAVVSGRPRFFDGPLDTALFVGAVAVLLIGGSLVFTQTALRVRWGRLAAAGVALTAWTVLMMVDDRWSIATFAIYALCYSFGRRLSLLMAAYVSIVWAAAMLRLNAPVWVVVMPLGVFTVSSILAVTIERISELNERKSELISELRATQRELVDAERTKGVLAERTRMAAEIHDTLAQGFTSIVLLSRAGIRSGDATQALKSIEETAQENLADARRLIEAIRPPELGAGSLPMALERQLDSVLPDEVDRHFAVEGEPRALNGAVEVTVLRAAQEALLNIRTHARADRVDMVLRFSEESVTLDVRDNGVGFTAGEVADRGDLTGGQGLALLRRRAESLSGRLDLGPGGSNGTSRGAGRGSHVSLTLPVIGS